MRNLFSAILLLVLAQGLGLSAQAQTYDPDYLDGSIYLKVLDSSTVDLDPYANNIPALNTILTLFGVDSLYQAFRTPDPVLEKIYRLEFSNIANTGSLITQLSLLPFVEYAEKVPLYEVIGTDYLPNDLQSNQYGLIKINAQGAWDLGRGDSQVKVAVIDNAVYTSHEDLTNGFWTNPGEIPNNLIDDDLNGYIDDVLGFDVADFDSDVNPPLPVTGNSWWHHGTHCAGIAGAQTDNGVGVASIGFNLGIIPVKASATATGGGTLERAYEAIDYAMAAGAQVISMSWGGRGNSVTGNTLLSRAENRGILLVAAAGNEGDSIPFYPAAYPSVLSVGSTNSADLKSSFSNYGSYVDLMAPGTSIYSCLAGAPNDYGSQSGTSMACPMVAGLAGLALAADPTLDVNQLKNALLDGCDNIDLLNPQFAGKMGRGRINAYNTLSSIVVASPEGQWRHGDLLVYPNPAQDEVHLRMLPGNNLRGPVKVTIRDLTGRALLTHSASGLEQGLSLPLQNLPAGLLLIEVQSGQQKETFKVVHR